MSKIHHAACFLDALLRMKSSGNSLCVRSKCGSFRIWLRIDDSCTCPGSQDVAFDICILPPPDDDKFLELLRLDVDGYFEDEVEDVFVLDSFCFRVPETTSDPTAHPQLQAAMAVWNKVLELRVCPCQAYFIKDAASICLHCAMTNRTPDPEMHPCAICQENGLVRHMKCQDCCSGYLHHACVARYMAKVRDAPCPLCKSPK